MVKAGRRIGSTGLILFLPFAVSSGCVSI